MPSLVTFQLHLCLYNLASMIDYNIDLLTWLTRINLDSVHHVTIVQENVSLDQK